MKLYYMHTLDGRPASYYDGQGICFAHKKIKLATSLRQIRREQKLSAAQRANDGYPQHHYRHAYVTVAL